MCTEQWERLVLRCALSQQRLTDPARGDQCTHSSRCNYATLRAYVGRQARCPIAGCDARLKRVLAIERDAALCDALRTVPPELDAVLVKGCMVRPEPPKQVAVAASVLDCATVRGHPPTRKRIRSEAENDNVVKVETI